VTTDKAYSHSGGIEERAARRRQTPLDAVFYADAAKLRRELASVLGVESPLHRLVDTLPVVGMDPLEKKFVGNFCVHRQTKLLLRLHGPDELPAAALKSKIPSRVALTASESRSSLSRSAFSPSLRSRRMRASRISRSTAGASRARLPFKI